MDEQILIYAAILVAVIHRPDHRRDFKSLPQVQERRGIGSIW